jgi:DNA-binding response OmpR family regulator
MTTDRPEDPEVLIVEDEPDVATTYELWLSDGYDVRVVHEGDEALDRLDDDVRVVLLDRMLPGLTGDEVLDAINERDMDCRVAMVTAVEPDFDIVEMGFDAYLTKPVWKDELTETVESLLARTDYSTTLQEYTSLVGKRAALEAEKSPAELEDSEDYQALQAEIDDVSEELDTAVVGMSDDEDFVATVREIADDADGEGGST